jgi:hypothetical protein
MLDDNGCKQKYGPHIAFLAIVALLVGATLASYSQRPLPRPAVGAQYKQTQPGQPNQPRGTQEFPFIVETHEGAPSQEIAAQQAEDREQQATNEHLHIAIEVLLALATIGIVVYTAKLVTGAEDTARRQLRAYVSSSPAGLHYDAVNGLRARFLIKNHGQTPAYEVMNIGRCAVLPHPLPKNFPFPDLPATGNSKSTIHANEADSFAQFTPADRPISIDDLVIALSGGGSNRLYCYGIIRYVDAFRISRTTKFMGSYSADRMMVALIRATLKPPPMR